jgi:ketosteroid isomerase-like protein
MRPGASFASGNRVAVNWAVEARAKTGKTAEFAGINVFTLDDEGKISQLEGYWDFKQMVAQIS